MWSGSMIGVGQKCCQSQRSFVWRIATVQLVDQVVCNVMEKHRVTLLRCIYSMYKSCHLECKMQDE